MVYNLKIYWNPLNLITFGPTNADYIVRMIVIPKYLSDSKRLYWGTWSIRSHKQNDNIFCDTSIDCLGSYRNFTVKTIQFDMSIKIFN
jgi:hypothetical protein